MSLVKPAGIQGMSASHPLAANVRQFWEFGQLNKDLVTDAVITSTATTETIADMGTVRKFSVNTDAPTEMFPFRSSESVFFIKKHLGTASSDAFTYADIDVSLPSGYSYFDFTEWNFSGNQYSKQLRAGGNTTDLDYTPYTSGLLPKTTAEIVHTSTVINDTTAPLYINGVTVPVAAVASSSTDTVFQAEPINRKVCSHVQGNGATYVAAIIAFDRLLTEAEILSVQADPWALVNVGPRLIVEQATLTPGSIISGTTADYVTAPTVLTVSDGVNTISSGGATPEITDLTITAGATGTYTWSFTMPALPVPPNSASSILFTNTATVELT